MAENNLFDQETRIVIVPVTKPPLWRRMRPSLYLPSFLYAEASSPAMFGLHCLNCRPFSSFQLREKLRGALLTTDVGQGVVGQQCETVPCQPFELQEFRTVLQL